MAIDSTHSNTVSKPDFTLPVNDRISWGAILAGVSTMLAITWLLLLLGTAIGVGVADATDLGAIGDGLGIGAIIWILLTMVVATLIGGVLAAVLSGTINDRIGALHGLTVWAIGILVTVVLGASGIGGAINAVGGAVGGAVSSAGTASTSVVTRVTNDNSDSMLPESVTTSIAAIMKRQAANLIGETSQTTNRNEARSAIESLSAQDASAITSALVSGDMDKAQSELAQRTTLSEKDITSIIDNAEGEVQSWMNSDEMDEAQDWLSEQYASVKRSASQSLSNLAGSQTSTQEINQAISQLNSDTLMKAGRHLVMGQTEMAKDVLALNTDLSEADIEAVVNGAEKEAMQLVNEAKAELNKVTEAVGTYTQAVLWSAFVAAALALIAGLVGGHIGSGAVRRVYLVR